MHLEALSLLDELIAIGARDTVEVPLARPAATAVV
jgi:hypothetical protein